MKVKTSSEVDNLVELFGEIILNEDENGNENGPLEEKLSNLTLDGPIKNEEKEDSVKESTCEIDLDGLKSLRRKKKEIKDNDDHDSESTSEQAVVHKRGPHRGNKPPPHVSTPYTDQNRNNSLYQSAPPTRIGTTNRQLFLSGGDELTKESPEISQTFNGFPSAAQEPLLPDFSQLLSSDNTFFEIEKENDCLTDQFPLNDVVSEDTVNSLIKNNLDLDLLSSEDFPDLSFYDMDELTDFGISDIFPNSVDSNNESPGVAEADFGISDIFPNSVNSNNESPGVAEAETTSQNIEEQFSPVSSTDTGYISDRSYPNSPDTSFTVVIETSKTFSGSVTVVNPPCKGKKKRNKYFNGLNEKLCDTYRRAILKKAHEKDGLNQKDEDDRTLLHVAIEAKNEAYTVVFLNMLQKSFQNGTGKNTLPTFADLSSFLNQEDKFGRTALLLACTYNLPRVVEYLLDCGASTQLGDKFSRGTVLHYVCEKGKRFFEVADILCSKMGVCIHTTNGRKETPLHIAVGYHGIEHDDASSKTKEVVDNLTIVQLLLDKNAMLSSQDDVGRTPLHWMMITKNLDLLDTFYARARDWNHAVNLQNADGRTVLHGAASLGSLDLEKQFALVQKLVVRCASPMICDRHGMYPKDLVAKDRKKHFSDILSGYFCEKSGWQTTSSFS